MIYDRRGVVDQLYSTVQINSSSFHDLPSLDLGFSGRHKRHR
jgi:hypothetical protein